MATHQRGKAPSNLPQKGIEEPMVSPVTPDDFAVTSSSLSAPVVPAAEPVAAITEGFSKVNLAEVCCINGSKYGPGVGIEVPTDAFQIWRHALAK